MKKKVFLVLLLLFSVTLSGCGSEATNNKKEVKKEEAVAKKINGYEPITGVYEDVLIFKK